VRRLAVEREREVAERIGGVRGPVVQRARAQRLQLVVVPRPQGHLAHVRAPQGLRRIAARYDKLATTSSLPSNLPQPSVPGLRVRSLAGRLND
jgi:hypothetical protein